MTLQSYSVGNLRSFVLPTEVELRPLTLLFGYNNAGKSALARVLPLISHSIDNPRGLPLNLASPSVRGGAFADLRSRLTGNLQLELILKWSGIDQLSLHFILADLPEKRRHIVYFFEFSREGKVELSADWQEEVSGASRYTLSLPGQEKQIAELEWNGLSPKMRGTRSKELADIFERTLEALRELESTLWIGAIRRTPRRNADLPTAPPKDPYPDGTGAGDVLAWDAIEGGPMLPRIATWYEQHTGARLSVERPGDTYSITIGPHKVNLADAGEGMTQVLPVLVAGALAATRAQTEPTHLIVEQPELHLHPAAHAPLAKYFCEIAHTNPSLRMLIETHSENFLYGVQLAVVREELDPKDVLIYWLRQEEGRTDTTKITLDKWGRPDNWPRDVFSEETELMSQLLSERRKRGYK